MRRHTEHRMISHRYFLYLCRGVSWQNGCGTRTFNLSICAALGISCLNGCGLLWCGIIRWNTGPIISLWCIQAEMFTDIKRTCHMTIKGKKYEAFIYLDRCWLSKKLLRCPSSLSEETEMCNVIKLWFRRDSKIKIKNWWDLHLNFPPSPLPGKSAVLVW